MSYDLMVFEPSVAPRDPAGFRQWFSAQAEWAEDHDYAGPTVSSPSLQRWYAAMVRDYPNLQDPDLTDDQIDAPSVTDYSFGRSVIYCAFRWTIAEQAYETVRSLAVKHAVGFYDASGDEGDGEIYFPGAELRPPSGGAWRRVAQEFRDLESDQ